ncbi:cysteine--tRNA ligase [Chloropicon primus]|uniref:cysteine--tRNA ligase n=2 Tax=Chloropicon primus TaxID=1764295 RepID=A0A5B8MSR9_9CHLO|nr:cysteine--tRNA ligase [Chloropicon primus]UPR02775.1 cysteine--tRNA ligase [Chloropicon primus]|eukprot:QDZ23563.1 cysteine--tRNA ligase [Chloropicon primus]
MNLIVPLHSYAAASARCVLCWRGGARPRVSVSSKALRVAPSWRASREGRRRALATLGGVAGESARRSTTRSAPSALCSTLAGEAETSRAREATGTGPQVVLYNTKARKKQEFEARDPQTRSVTMYVCGVTVYDFSHIGHARVYTVFDVLYRFLRWRGYDVVYCRNFTDIDDKIIKRAQEVGQDCNAITDKFIDEFHTDMASLGNLSPTLEPRATEHIDAMIEQISRIIDNGHGYVVDGDVYFSVPSLGDYGSLSGRKQDDNRAGERVTVDERKRDPADFALWKAKKEGEPFWESPWGQGRPGWHIECSAMIHKLLGTEIDIHGGGLDLTFPHHENELAQSMASCKQCSDQFSRFWMHNGFVNVNTEKMSKSLGNFFTIREILERYHPKALRFFLLNTHYRSAINFSDGMLNEASARSYYLYQTLADCEDLLFEGEGTEATAEDCCATFEGSKVMLEDCMRAMSDDLGTQQTLSVLSPVLKSMNELLHTKKGRKNPEREKQLRGYYAGVTEIMQVLGLACADYKDVLQGMKECALRRCGRSAEEVEGMIKRRQEARKNKDFELSDRLRDELVNDGIALLDSPQGTVWQPVSIQ